MAGGAVMVAQEELQFTCDKVLKWTIIVCAESIGGVNRSIG
jgi:hypothetical protein